MDAAEIIKRLGGATQAAARLGLKRTTVQMWLGRDEIPPRHVPEVARVLGVDPAEVWPALATTQPSEAA